MHYRESVQVPPNLIDDAAYLAAEGSIDPEEATEGILLLEELGLATRCRMEGPVPPPPKTRMVVAHEIRDGQELQSFANGEPFLVAVLGDRLPLNQLHDEVRTAVLRCACVEHLGNVRVIHQG